eukprot:TRINITY_DN10534_c0_g2_i1.p2 TRINITY_DN10534_c0_g2~~TRINITY_DN10534_c0_g2_i1.p2  ORF type:complete len:162 (+),score=17.43 TRINITY_DN10534_c0_g2_i1:61-546(+)
MDHFSTLFISFAFIAYVFGYRLKLENRHHIPLRSSTFEAYADVLDNLADGDVFMQMDDDLAEILDSDMDQSFGITRSGKGSPGQGVHSRLAGQVHTSNRRWTETAALLTAFSMLSLEVHSVDGRNDLRVKEKYSGYTNIGRTCAPKKKTIKGWILGPYQFG